MRLTRIAESWRCQRTGCNKGLPAFSECYKQDDTGAVICKPCHEEIESQKARLCIVCGEQPTKSDKAVTCSRKCSARLSSRTKRQQTSESD